MSDEREMTSVDPPLEPLEQPVESGRSSILGGSLLLGTSTVVQLAASFLIGVLVSRALGAEGKGQLALLQQVPGIGALVLGLGFSSANAYFVGRRKQPTAGVIADSLALTAVVSAIGVPLLYLAMRRFVPALEGTAEATLWLAALTVPVVVAAGTVTGVLVGQGRLRGQAVAQSVSAITAVSVVAASYALGRLGLGVVIGASIVGTAALLALAIGATGIGGFTRPSVARIAERWRYARRSYITSITGYLELRQDVLLLGILSTAAGVGIYSVGAAFAELLWYAPQVTTTPLMARAYQEDERSGAEIAAGVARLMTAFMVVGTLVLAVVLRPAIVAIFGEQFEAAATVFLILAPGIVLAGISGQLSSFMSTQGRLFPGVAAAGLVANLVLNLVLIPTYGFYGAAISTAISYAGGAIYLIGRFLKATGLRATDVLLVRRDDLRLALAAVRALASRVRP